MSWRRRWRRQQAVAAGAAGARVEGEASSRSCALVRARDEQLRAAARTAADDRRAWADELDRHERDAAAAADRLW